MKIFTLKILFWILFTGALAMAVLMRYHSKRSQISDFNIMRFEYPADRVELDVLIEEWSQDPKKTNLLSDQLRLDYAFMSLLFPAILVLCFWAKKKVNADLTQYNTKVITSLLTLLGGLQLLAWSFDVCENSRLEHWLSEGEVENIFFFKIMVILKFSIGILGFLLAIGVWIFLYLNRRNSKI